MTVTILHSGDDNEPLAETIRYLIANNWTASIEPVVMSPSGIGTNPASPKTNFGYNWRKLSNRDLIRLYNGGDETLVQGRLFTEMQTTVYIDIFARNDMTMYTMVNEVNRIIFENQPNVNTRLTTSSAHTSRITGFIQNIPSWVYPSDLTETGASVQAATELDCKWQVHLS